MTQRPWIYLMILALLAVACGSNPTLAPATPAPTTPIELVESPTPDEARMADVITDDLGRTIEFNPPAQAIVALGPSILESLFAIGAGDQVVGREEFSTFPEEALEIPSVGSLFGELPVEAILALEPDFVIAPEIIAPEQVQTLEDLGLTVFWQANPQDFEGLYASLTVLGRLTGHEAGAKAVIADLTERVAAVDHMIARVVDRPSVFYELDATDPLNPYTVGAGTFIDTVITRAGGDNIGAVLQGEYAQISSEEIILQDPQVILLGDAPYGISPESVASRAGWENIRAVLDDRVYPFDPFLVSVPGPRLVEGLEVMAALLHPDLFE